MNKLKPAADFMKTVFDGLASAVQFLIDKFNTMKAAASEAFATAASVSAGIATGGMSEVIRAVPKFADGGIVTRPTLGLVGEAGPEAIIPLSQARSMGGSVNVSIVVNGDVTGEDLIERVRIVTGKK